MAFKRYDPKTKDSIMKAATEARAAGKSWSEAHAAAKAAGYKGSPEGLDVMIRNAKDKAGKAKSAPAAKASPTKPTTAKASTPKPLIAKRYDPKTKAAIKLAANSARSQGKTWAAAHSAATEAGYKGGVQGLVKMIRAAKKKPKASPVATTKPSTKPTIFSKSPPTEGYDPVRKMIDQIVKQKVRAVVEKAIAELRKAIE